MKAPLSHPAFRNQIVNCNFVEWKELYGNQFADVVSAFAAYFGVPTSSAGIELDFYFASLLLTKQRMSMKTPLIEMMHMVDRNRKWVDLTQVSKLTIQESTAVRPNFIEAEHYVFSDDEEDMNHAEEHDEVSGSDDYDGNEHYEADVEEKQRVDLRRKKNVERKKKEAEDLFEEQKNADESVRFEAELRRNLLAKQKLVDQRTLERLRHEKRLKKKADLEKDQKKKDELNESIRRNELKKLQLEEQMKKEEEEKESIRRNESKKEEENKKSEQEQKPLTDKEWEVQNAQWNDEMCNDWSEKVQQESKEQREANEAKEAKEAKEQSDRMTMEKDAREFQERKESDRVVQVQHAAAMKENEMADKTKENGNASDKVQLARPTNRHTVKCDTDKKFFDEGKINRREMLEEKRREMVEEKRDEKRAQAVSPIRRKNIVDESERERERFEEEMETKPVSYISKTAGGDWDDDADELNMWNSDDYLQL